MVAAPIKSSNSLSYKYYINFGSYSGKAHLNGSKASGVITHAEMVEPKFFALKGPKGTYSQTYKSRADQSFNKT